MKKLTKRVAGKRSRKAKRLEPADVLQLRMDYYTELAKKEMAKGELGSREEIQEYLKLAQDAAKELAPYRIARAQAGDGDDEKRNYVMRVGAFDFKNAEEWLFYYNVVVEKNDSEIMQTAGASVNDRMLQILRAYKPNADGIQPN